MAKSWQELRALKQAAMAGDYAAARALLRLEGHKDVAREIKAGKPWSPRVARWVAVCTAGVGTGPEPGEWESFDPETGEIVNDLDVDMMPRVVRPRPMLDED
jgi:hypothetical protein